MTRQKQNPVVVKLVPLSSLAVRGPRRARPGLSGLVIGIILLLASLTGPGFAQAGPTLKVYKHVDENGVTHYSSKKPRGVKYSILRIRCPECTWKNKVNWHTTPLITDRFTDIIRQEAARAGFEPALIMAIIHAESGFNPNNVSSAGAQGLMQLMPATQKRFAVRSAFSPRQNIRAGVTYLRDLMKRFNGNLDLVLAAYNAGENAVLAYDKTIPPFDETRNYVKRVKILYKRYKKTLL